MKTTLLICVELEPLSPMAPADGADRAEHRRKMIRETERYLSDPDSRPWARLHRGREARRQCLATN